MSRAEKRLEKRVQQMRDQETHDDPTIQYRRTVVKTKMYWPLELMRRGETRVIFQYIAVWAFIIIAFGAGLVLLIRFILLHFGWWPWL
jgi:hypothetical protein